MNPGYFMIVMVGTIVTTMLITLSSFDWEEIRRNAEIVEQLDGEPWCVSDYRGEVNAEFKARGATVFIDWEGDPNDGWLGQASWFYDEDTEFSLCAVEIPLPERVWGDIDMETVGHEFLHCVIGDFHEE